MSVHTPHSSRGSNPADARQPGPLEIAELTRQMAHCDERAYRSFYDAYFLRLLRYLLVVTAGDEEAARDALQATLVRVVRHIRPFPNEEVFWGWLTVLARSALTDQTRKRHRYLSFLDRFTRHSQIEQVAPDDAQPDARLLAALETGLANLPQDERDLVERKYLARQSVRQIAAGLEASEKAVESKLVRVRRKLKQAVLLALKHEPPT